MQQNTTVDYRPWTNYLLELDPWIRRYQLFARTGRTTRYWIEVDCVSRICWIRSSRRDLIACMALSSGRAYAPPRTKLEFSMFAHNVNIHCTIDYTLCIYLLYVVLPQHQGLPAGNQHVIFIDHLNTLKKAPQCR